MLGRCAGAEEVYSYDAAGQLVTVVIGGTTRARTDYDLLGRVTSHVEYDGWGMAVHKLGFQTRINP